MWLALCGIRAAHLLSGDAVGGEQVRELLSPLVGDPDVSMEIGGAAALALGLVFISSQDEECVGAALQVYTPPPFLHTSCPHRQYTHPWLVS